MSELGRFFEAWEREADRTERLLGALPAGRYDFRPDPAGRSLGQLAWHLAEVDAYMSAVIVEGGFHPAMRPPNLDRPRTVPELAPRYAVVHGEAVDRLAGLGPADLDTSIDLFGASTAVRDILWDLIVGHAAHHRGQLTLMCRLAGGRPPGLYGPTREGMVADRGGEPGADPTGV